MLTQSKKGKILLTNDSIAFFYRWNENVDYGHKLK
jgi:hypothetical protein